MSDRFGMTGNFLVHSAKGTSWEKKDHKYVFRKRGKNGKWIYVYKNQYNNLEMEYDSRKEAEDSEAFTSTDKRMLEKYGIPDQSSVERRAFENTNTSNVGKAVEAKRYGGNGMPSNEANKNIELAERKVDAEYKSNLAYEKAKEYGDEMRYKAKK